MLRTLRSLLSFAAGALALLLLLEGVFRVLPTMSGLGPSRATDAYPLRAYEPSRPYQYSYGWDMLNAQQGTTNNYGQIAPRDFVLASRPLIVVGDSYVESLMNDYGDTLQGVLGERLGVDRPVYGFGVSGLAASDYLVLARLARDEFTPSAAVFVITDGDFVESFAPRPGAYHLERNGGALALAHRALSPSPAMDWVRSRIGRSALYDYLRSNLKFSPSDVWSAFKALGRGTATAAPSAPAAASENSRQALEWFLRELPAASGVVPACTVLLVDADRYAIYDPSDASTPKDPAATRSRLLTLGHELGFHVVDLGPTFAAEYERTRLKLDYWPVDRHWNKHGHAVAADVVMKTLFDGNAGSSCTPGVHSAASE